MNDEMCLLQMFWAMFTEMAHDFHTTINSLRIDINFTTQVKLPHKSLRDNAPEIAPCAWDHRLKIKSFW